MANVTFLVLDDDGGVRAQLLASLGARVSSASVLFRGDRHAITTSIEQGMYDGLWFRIFGPARKQQEGTHSEKHRDAALWAVSRLSNRMLQAGGAVLWDGGQSNPSWSHVAALSFKDSRAYNVKQTMHRWCTYVEAVAKAPGTIQALVSNLDLTDDFKCECGRRSSDHSRWPSTASQQRKDEQRLIQRLFQVRIAPQLQKHFDPSRVKVELNERFSRFRRPVPRNRPSRHPPKRQQHTQ